MTTDGFRTAPMKDGIRYDSRGEPINSEAERYRAILDDTARWLEHWGPGDTPEKVAATIRHWLDDPADFDQYAGMAASIRGLSADRLRIAASLLTVEDVAEAVGLAEGPDLVFSTSPAPDGIDTDCMFIASPGRISVHISRQAINAQVARDGAS